MTTVDRPDFHIVDAEALAKITPLELYPGVTAQVINWTSPADGADPLPREAYVRFAPGHGYTEPDHHGDSSEIVVVVEGELQDEGGTYPVGSRVHGARGSTHTPRSETGCLLYVMFPER
ncbi:MULTISPECIES: cupin domain-containing protein [unclassified Streptomyces]|uniref:cupin domain-containing protein n=1 Tax=unclassified Streptomyces TaxID=2593676 RepID=UPI002DDA9EAF|nr:MULTISPECIES: cupin domain-containing protein [unclassified Streptomyces]WSA93139.1 cupin domain-containing protein [Streptomyces sp. NBC_01795]WSB77510.1 cupin domain-containing protein [Streptomyces sp. NBC_01775]WSS14224.1 cupin domain-containing protein [Streptomyces sp. NBC_01186]WSS43045.1 cupin domain-containing protein [Streptomyces sp. NBC_01187]